MPVSRFCATGGRVLNFLNACFFAEAPPNTSVTTGSFLPDTARNFYLVAGDATWAGSHALPESACKAGEFCWNGKIKTCKLVIRD